MKRHNSIKIITLCLLTIVLLSCGKEVDFIEEPDLIDQIDGFVKNRIDGSGIQGVTINMNRKENEFICFSSCTPNISFTSTITDDNGLLSLRMITACFNLKGLVILQKDIRII